MSTHMKFFLWHAVRGEFDTDWHRSAVAAEVHAARCGLNSEWRVVGLTDAQIADIFQAN